MCENELNQFITFNSKINPADCVDMECDGMKNVLIKDTDGTLLGGAGAIIPDVSVFYFVLTHLCPDCFYLFSFTVTGCLRLGRPGRETQRSGRLQDPQDPADDAWGQ